MNLDSLTAALSHIGNLVASLTKKSLNSSVQEIQEVVRQFGGEAERHLYRVLIGHLEWSGPQSGETHRPSPNNNNNNKDKETPSSVGVATLGWSSTSGGASALLIQHFATTLPHTSFIANLAFATANPPSPSKYIKAQWVSGVCKALRLSRVQEITLSIQLLQATSVEVRNQATALLKAKLPDLVRAYVDTESGDRELLELPTEVLHQLLTQIVHLWRDPPSALLPQESRQAFICALQREFPRSRVPVVLAPLLYPDSDILMETITEEPSASMAKNLLDGSLADLVLELGYSFCNAVEECRSNLLNFGVGSITPAAVAKVLGVMVRTHTGLPSEQI